MTALSELTDALTPSPVGPNAALLLKDWSILRHGYWERIAGERPAALRSDFIDRAREFAEFEALAGELAAGECLVHGDIRADNVLLTDDRVWFVDWAHAYIGAPWVDVVLMAPSVWQYV